MRTLANFVIFQIIWFSCVLGGDWVAVVVTASGLAVHLFWVAERRGEWKWLLAGALGGTLIDTVLMHSGLLVFPSESLVVPLWLIALWFGFSSCMNSCLSWAGRYRWLGALGGLLGGPLAYTAGTRLGEIEWGEPLWFSLGVHGVVWAIVMPVYAVWAGRMTEAAPSTDGQAA